MRRRRPTHCPLCAAKVGSAKPVCAICGTDLLKQPCDPPSRPRYQRGLPRWVQKRWLGWGALALLLILPLFFVGDLILTPSQDARARSTFRDQARLLAAEPERFAAAIEELATHSKNVAGVSSNALVAYLYDRIGTKEHLALAVHDEGAPRHVQLSKREAHIFPLHIILSVEVEIGDQIRILSLRRGCRPISPDLAWVYFARELQALQQLTSRDTSPS